ncbi:hypothetical protein G9A89_008618 [Geosiphon pyriformis]|nr:hypothetical protein G9A89_008618 [Geosiphon pyriformis]
MSFAQFKNTLLEYFSDPNAVIQLQNEFNTIKQGTGKTIEAIEQGYYMDPQVLNQFIRGLKSSILGRVHSVHPNSLPEAITLTKALESAKKEANYSQMVNIIIEKNKTETLKKRVMQLGEELSKKIESYLILDPRRNTYQPPQRHSQEKNKAIFNGVALDKKCPITAIYTEATINNISIKLILDSRSTGSIIMLQLVNQLGFKVNCAAMSQIITANRNTKLPHDWTTQELLINYNSHQTRIPVTCGHFQKPSTNQKPTFKFEENSTLPVIKTYQLFWADDQRAGLPAVLTWTSKERSEWNQKDMENGTKNCVSLVENCYQESVTGMTYQAEEEHVTQLANT